MFLGADQGTELVVEVAGEDAAEAVEALAALLSAPSAEDGLEPSTASSQPPVRGSGAPPEQAHGN